MLISRGEFLLKLLQIHMLKVLVIFGWIRFWFESNKEALDISEKQFELGGLNTADYLASKNAYVKAESDYLQAKYELVFRKKVLDFYSGKPLN